MFKSQRTFYPNFPSVFQSFASCVFFVTESSRFLKCKRKRKILLLLFLNWEKTFAFTWQQIRTINVSFHVTFPVTPILNSYTASLKTRRTDWITFSSTSFCTYSDFPPPRKLQGHPRVFCFVFLTSQLFSIPLLRTQNCSAPLLPAAGLEPTSVREKSAPGPASCCCGSASRSWGPAPSCHLLIQPNYFKCRWRRAWSPTRQGSGPCSLYFKIKVWPMWHGFGCF